MTNVEKLQAWLDKEKEKGLTDYKFSLNYDATQGITAEVLAGELLEMNEAIERGDYTEVLTFEDYKEGESCGPNCECYPTK